VRVGECSSGTSSPGSLRHRAVKWLCVCVYGGCVKVLLDRYLSEPVVGMEILQFCGVRMITVLVWYRDGFVHDRRCFSVVLCIRATSSHHIRAGGWLHPAL